MSALNRLQPYFAALRFLTVLPVPEAWCGGQESFRKSPDWYPLVGLTIGLSAALFDLLMRLLLPLPVASVMLLIFLIAITGALHMDGLADSADAFFSSRGRERMLEIMKDSCAGPMGVTAIVLVLLLKLSLLTALPQQLRFEVLVLMPLCGRSSISLLSYRLPYARPEGGTAAFTNATAGRGRMLVALLVLTVGSLALLGGTQGLLVIIATIATSLILGGYCLKKIGGYTGDTLGACCELIDLVPLLVVVVLARVGGWA